MSRINKSSSFTYNERGYDSDEQDGHRRHRHRNKQSMQRPTPPIRYTKSRSRSRSPQHHRRRRHSRSSSRSYGSKRRRSPSHSPGRSDYRGRQAQKSAPPLQGRCLGIFGLNMITTEDQMRSIFGKYGPIQKVQLVYDAKTGKSRGFCFVYFEQMDDARVAKDNCSGMDIDGRRIRVDYSITQRPHSPTPGIYKGQPLRSHEHRSKRTRSRSPRRRRRSRTHSPRDSRYR